jgi:hypothetical protein
MVRSFGNAWIGIGLLALAVTWGPASICAAESLSVSSLDLTKIDQGWGTPHPNQSVEGRKMSINGQTYEEGIGTHADSVFLIDLDRKAKRFTAMVGIDDEVRDNGGSVVFRIAGDGKDLYDSGLVRSHQAARKVDVDLTGIKTLVLMVRAARTASTMTTRTGPMPGSSIKGPNPRPSTGPRRRR